MDFTVICPPVALKAHKGHFFPRLLIYGDATSLPPKVLSVQPVGAPGFLRQKDGQLTMRNPFFKIIWNAETPGSVE